MPNFFIWSKDGDALFLAQRLAREGHSVRMHIHKKESQLVGAGLIQKANVANPRKGELVIFDMVGFGKEAERLKRQGFKVLGGCALADKLELDRGFAMRLMRESGIEVPETQEFDRLDQARSFLAKRERGESWYLKVSGDEDCASTHGAKDVEDMLRWFEYLEVSKHVPKRFLLQKKMDNKAELSLEGWFDGNKWVLPWNSTIEDKRLFAGDVGPNTGCMANVVWAYEERMPLLAMRTLTRIAGVLRGASYVGPIDINVILGNDGTPFGLEFTARFGYLALQSLSLLVGGDFGSQLWEFANGTLDHFEVINDKYSLSIGVSVPPYPNDAREAHMKPLDPTLLYDPIRIMLSDVMVLHGRPYITGRDANVGSFGDTWHDLHELRSMVLGRIKEYAIPDAQYRTDPVKRAEEEFEFLREHDYEIPKPKPLEFKAPVATPISEGRERLFNTGSDGPDSGPSQSVNTSNFDIPSSPGMAPQFN